MMASTSSWPTCPRRGSSHAWLIYFPDQQRALAEMRFGLVPGGWSPPSLFDA
jgi:hypothetical protein